MPVTETNKDRVVRFLWELENASFECGKQGGEDLDAIRKDNVEYTARDILNLLNTVRI